MKPHPRIRKTIKWGGAALTVLLVVVWIGSMRYCVSRSKGHWIWTVYPGRVFMAHHSGPGGWNYDAWQAARQPGMYAWGWWFEYTPGNPVIKGFIPLWFPILITLLPTALAFRLDTLARRRANMNLCPKCHYDRTGLAIDAKCPECGTGSGTA